MDNGASSYRRFQQGDKDAIALIIHDYKDGLILYLYRFTGDITLAEELAEDTFVRIYARKPRFSGKSSFKTWLYAIGRHTALDYIKKNRLRNAASLDECEGLAAVGDLERSYVRKEQSEQARYAMSRLKSEYRQVLWLMFSEELSTAETARIMGKSKKQIGNLVYRAKKALRTELEKEGFCYEEL